MSVDLLNPALLGKQVFKKKLTEFVNEIPQLVEDFLFDFAEKELLNPFDLVIFIHTQNDEVAGDLVLTQEDKTRIKVGSLEFDTFLNSQDFTENLSMLPQQMKDNIADFLQGKSIEQVIMDHLKEQTYIINFDKKQEIQFLQRIDGTVQRLDLAHLFNVFGNIF